MRKYQGQQKVDWPSVWYTPMPGLNITRIPPMRCALGLEPTPEAYIGHLVLCFREVKRVLRDDGTCWINIGDSYHSQGGAVKNLWGDVLGQSDARASAWAGGQTTRENRAPGLQPGDLMLIPHRLALALQSDGWLVRNDVVWHKKSPMPESVAGWRWERCRVKVAAAAREFKGHERLQGARDDNGKDFASTATWHPCPGCDKCRENGGYVLRRGSWRHTRAHETVWMLAKNMNYYADQERVREGFAYAAEVRVSKPKNIGGLGLNPTRSYGDKLESAGRNPRSVLTPSPENYKGAHYAVYPRTLISPLLRATAPTRVCPVCGAPWAPVVERTVAVSKKCPKADVYQAQGGDGPKTTGTVGYSGSGRIDGTSITIAHRPTCGCANPDTDPWTELREYPVAVPGWALDPFAGTGTTLEVCAELGVNAVGLDISPEYLDEHAKPRIGLTPSGALETLPLFEGMT